MTANLIVQLQEGYKEATLALINKFHPLLKKYAFKLRYEDAYDDLLVDFIEILNRIRLDRIRDTSEGVLISYICKSIRGSYIKRLITLKRLCSFLPYSDLSKNELYYVETLSSASDSHFRLELTGIDQVLTESELYVVKMIYLLGYTVAEIASLHGITRQAVNKTKKRALQKLAKWL